MSDQFNVFAGWVIDGTGGPVRHNVLLQIEGGLIVSMRRAENPEALRNPFVDLSSCTIVPGLVDCHVHLLMSGTADEQVRRKQLSYTFEEAAPVISKHVLEHLEHGIMALRDGGDYGAYTLRYKKQYWPADTKGTLQLMAPGKAWRAQGRYGRFIGRPPADGRSLAECIATLNDTPDHIKIINSGLNSLKQLGAETPPQFTADQLDAAVSAARKRSLKIMVHANGRLAVRQAVDAGCFSVEHGFFMGKENLQRMADLQIFWVPTAVAMKGYAEELDCSSTESDIARKTLDHQLSQIAQGRELGVPVVIGTDSGSLGVNHGKAFVDEMKLLMDAGFTLEETISCASMEGARLLGLRSSLGQIKKGMPASFVVCKGEPAFLPDSLRFPERVFVMGIELKGGIAGNGDVSRK